MESTRSESDRTERAKRGFLTVWTIVGAILLTGVLVYLFNILSVPVGIVIWTVVIVFCLRGPVNKLEKLGVPRVVGTALAYVLMFAVLALVGLLLFSPVFGVGDQFTNLIESIPGYVQTIVGWGNDLYARYADVLSNSTVQEYLSPSPQRAGGLGLHVRARRHLGRGGHRRRRGEQFVAIGFALVVAFWMLMELPALGPECKRLVGPKRRDDLEMLHVTFTRVMGGYIKGTLLQCAIIGVGCGVLFGVVGVPNYAALGGIAGLLNIVPIVGPWLGGALAAIVGVFVSPWIAACRAARHHRHPADRLHVRLAEDHGELGGRAPGAHPHRLDGGLGHRRRDERLHRLARGHARIHSGRRRREVRFRVLLREAHGPPAREPRRSVLPGHPGSRRCRRPHRRRDAPHPDISAAFERVGQRKADAEKRARHDKER